MDLDDFFESEVVIAVAATIVALSPRARKILRRGAVYGVAGALMAGDALKSFSEGVSRGAHRAAETAQETVGELREETSEG